MTGKSFGSEINFNLIDENTKLKFLHQIQTIFGASFLALSVDHPFNKKFIKSEESQNQKVTKLYNRGQLQMLKNCLFYKFFCGAPFYKNKKLPVYFANFVLMDYGTGAIFVALPDQRDFQFAKKYNLKITQVVSTNADKKELSEASQEVVK